MKHDIAAVDELGEKRLVVHRVDEVLEAGPALEVRDVINGSCREIVEDEHVIAVRQQRLGEIGPDEASPAGD